MKKTKKNKSKKQKNYKVHGVIYSILLILLVINLTILIIQKEARASFKRLYGNYSRALQTTVNQMEGDTACYFSSEKEIPNEFSGCEKFFKMFATNLRVSKYCKDNAFKNGCIPAYKKYITTSECAGFSESMMKKYNQSFVMGDTTTLTVYNRPANEPKPILAVDSNGKMFPNKTGYDVFSLVIMRTPSGSYYFHPNVTFCLPPEKGAINSLQDVYK